MREPRKIIRMPLVSEKSTNMRIKENKYVFKVDKKANKLEIKRAIEELFKVKVEVVFKRASLINPYDLLNSDFLIMTKKALEKVEEVFAQ